MSRWHARIYVDRNMTLEELAEEVGVSRSTCEKALKGRYDSLSWATREKFRKWVEGQGK